MKITIFTSNQKRHISLVNKLSQIADECFAVIESNTVFPGQKKDFFEKSEVMQTYFKKVQDAERVIFCEEKFISKKAKILPLKWGDLNYLSYNQLEDALNSDIYIVFGSSFIKSWLIEELIKNIEDGLRKPLFNCPKPKGWE